MKYGILSSDERRHLCRGDEVFRLSLTVQQVHLVLFTRQPAVDVLVMNTEFSQLQRSKSLNTELLFLDSYIY